MTVTALGSLSVGDAVTGCTAAVNAGVTGIGAALPDLLARIAALQNFSPLPVSLDAQLVLAQQILAGVQSAIALQLPMPDISAQLAAVAALLAQLLAALSLANAQLDICTSLQGFLGAGGVDAYAFDGTVGNFGTELSAEIGVDIAHGNALVLLTRLPATWTALSAVVRVTP